METEIIYISWYKLALGSIFALILLGISFYESIKMEKVILIAVFRCTVQLIFLGYLLHFIFNLNKWYYVVLILIVMLLTASHTLIQRVTKSIKGTYIYAFFAVTVASVVSLFIMNQLIIGVSPWYAPQYLIPLAGMIIANGMNGAALAGERYRSELKLRLNEIEMYLSLGYDYKKASQKSRQKALSAGLIPTLNNMTVMGIVFLPGMMTGQIIAGSDPITAVKYQLLVVLALASSVVITSWILLSLLNKKFFTPHHQIQYHLINDNKS